MKRFALLPASAALAASGPAAAKTEEEIGNMANGQITIHQSHLPRHFFVGVPVGLAGSSYEKAMEMAYIVLTRSRKGCWRLKDLYRNDLMGEIHCQFGPNSTVIADAGFRRCVAACEAHLEDLRIEHAPLRSLTRAEMRRGD